MIYLKKSDNIISENVFVYNDKYQQEKNDFTVSNFFTYSGNTFEEQIFSRSSLDNFLKKRLKNKFDSYKLVNKRVCGNEIFSDLEMLLDCDLPDDLKLKYISRINGFYEFNKFASVIYPLFDLEEVSSYNISELNGCCEVCRRNGIYTSAFDIISDENIKTAEDNNKVLKLIRKYNDFNGVS